MSKNNEFAAQSAKSDGIASNEREIPGTKEVLNREEAKKTFGVAAMWAIRRAGRVFRIHDRLSRL
jgi:hypothetical protein